MKIDLKDKAEALENLKRWLKPGDTVYTILRDRSRSGMQRKISVLIQQPMNDGSGKSIFYHPNYAAAVTLGYKLASGPNDSLIVNGGGFDAGFEIVYNLGRVLWPNGICEGSTGKRAHKCHSLNAGPEPKGCTRRDGGYALRHEWL